MRGQEIKGSDRTPKGSWDHTAVDGVRGRRAEL